MAFELNTLHIFGYGEVQVIGKDGETPVNKKKPTASLTKLTAVVDNVYSKKPADNTAVNEYHSVNIFNGMFADYQPKAKGDKGWRVKYDELDAKAINALVAEVLA